MDIILDKLRDIELRYRELEGQLSDPKVVSKQGLYQKFAKEHSDLTELVETIRQYEKIKARIDEYSDLRKMMKNCRPWSQKKCLNCSRKRSSWKKKSEYC
jgi:peptide chain release factor 1